MTVHAHTEALAETIIATLRERGMQLATAESCTGGLVAATFTDIAGASDVFGYGFVTYANTAKTALLGVPATMISEHGAVSSEVAIAMADGARQRSRADVAVSLTGVAGPGGGTLEKPVGLVFIAVAQADQPTSVVRHLFTDNGRAGVRKQAVEAALNQVLAALNQSATP